MKRLLGRAKRAARDVASSPIRFHLDVPAEDDLELTGLHALVAGWAFADRDALEAIDILIDGTRVGSAQRGLSRSDVAAEHRRSRYAAVSGFRYGLDVAGLAVARKRSAVLTVRGVRQSGLRRDLVQRKVRVPDRFGLIDTPAEDTVIHGSTFEAAGWLHAPGKAVRGVEVLVDGATYGWAQVGLRRPDLGDVFAGDPTATHSGWRIEVSLGPDIGETVEVAVLAHLEQDGPWLLGRRTLSIADVVVGELSLSQGAVAGRGRLAVSGTVFVGILGANLAVDVDGRQVILRSLRPGTVGSTPWHAELDLSHATDEVEIVVRLQTPGGEWRRMASRRVKVIDAPGDIWQGALDAPQKAERAAIMVAGWALSGRAPIDAVEIHLDGKPLAEARLGTARRDVGASSALPEAPVAGFEAAVDLSHVPVDRDSIVLTAVVRDRTGSITTLVGRPTTLVAATQVDESDVRRSAILRARTGSHPIKACAVDGPIRALVFTHSLDYGGGQLYLSELLFRMVASGGVAPIVVAPDRGPLLDDLEAAGIPVHIGGHAPIDDVDGYEGWVAAHASWAWGQGFHVVVCNTLGTFPGVDLAARLGLPSVWAIHESFPPAVFLRVAYHTRDLHPYVRDRFAASFAAVAAAVFEADATRSLFSDRIGEGRSIVVPYGLNLDEIDRYRQAHDRSAARAALGRSDDEVLLLCLGTIEPRKAQTRIAQAFAEIAESHPDATLALVGDRGGAYSDALKETIRRSGLEARVEVVPIVPDTYPWYRAADILVLASDIESLPRTALEAMAFETLVASTSVFGLPELIEDGRNGYLCPPNDLGALANMLSRAIGAGPQERAVIGAAGRATIERTHRSEGYGRAYERLLEAIVADPSVRPADIDFGRQS